LAVIFCSLLVITTGIVLAESVARHQSGFERIFKFILTLLFFNNSKKNFEIILPLNVQLYVRVKLISLNSNNGIIGRVAFEESSIDIVITLASPENRVSFRFSFVLSSSAVVIIFEDKIMKAMIVINFFFMILTPLYKYIIY